MKYLSLIDIISAMIFFNFNWQQHFNDINSENKENVNMANQIRDQFYSEMNLHVENSREAYKFYNVGEYCEGPVKYVIYLTWHHTIVFLFFLL